MNNLIVKQILSQKGIPEEIEREIVQFLYLPKQVKLKREMILKLNSWYGDYWDPNCWNPRKSVPPKLSCYKYWRDSEEYNEYLIRNNKEGLYCHHHIK